MPGRCRLERLGYVPTARSSSKLLCGLLFLVFSVCGRSTGSECPHTCCVDACVTNVTPASNSQALAPLVPRVGTA